MSFLIRSRQVLSSSSSSSSFSSSVVPRSLTSTTHGVRAIHASSRRCALSEADHDQDHSERKEAIDKHKQDGLDKQKAGKGEWKRELSSQSEHAVKADREEIGDAHKDIESLQKQTAQASQDDHDHGKK